MADYAQWFASRGGKARAKALTTKERKSIGKKGATARWGKKKRAATSRMTSTLGASGGSS